jgi:hypothetical protein
MVLKSSAGKRTLDNITGVIIAFENFETELKGSKSDPINIQGDSFSK